MGHSKRYMEMGDDVIKFAKLMDIKQKTYTEKEVLELINKWSMIPITKNNIQNLNN